MFPRRQPPHTPPVDTPRQGIPAALAERYQLGRELGAGGMGVVYAARDLRHERPVAVKLIRPDVLSAAVVERFQREIAMAAKLTHPHIVALYDSGVEGSTLFFVMPLIEGETLRARLARDSRLPVAEVRRLAEHLGSALQYAHDRDVVHRDVKPENILLTSGGAMLTDFGIARGPQGSTGVTTTGGFIGSPRYSSPEQLKGDTAVGPSSDQYALACLLFEALAGRPPFEASNQADLVVAHVTAAPPKVRGVRAEVPMEMENALVRAMAKDPAARFPDVAAFAAAFCAEASASGGVALPTMPSPRRVGVAATLLVGIGFALWWSGLLERAPLERTVAVLICDNLSGDPAQDYYSLGVTEQIIGQLSGLSEISVINVMSVRRYQGMDKSAGQIARELKATHLVDCSVNRQPQRILITAALVDAETELQPWQDSYSYTGAEDYISVRDAAEKIADEVVLRLSGESNRPEAPRQTLSDSAGSLWQRGRAAWVEGSSDGLGRSINYFTLAAAQDSSFAQAHVGLADAHLSYVGRWMQRPSVHYPAAKASVDRALAVQPRLGEALAARGRLYHRSEWAWERARADLQQALQMNPSAWQPWLDLAKLESDRGNHTRAVELAEKGQVVDPHNALNVIGMAEILYFARRYPEALRQADLAIELEPDFSFNHLWRAMILLGMGRAEEAALAAWAADSLTGGHPGTLAIYARAEAEAGRPETALKVLDSIFVSTQYVPGTLVAVVYMGLGEFDKAFEEFERAVAERDWFIAELAVHPLADPVRDDPRLRPLLARMGLENVPRPAVPTAASPAAVPAPRPD